MTQVSAGAEQAPRNEDGPGSPDGQRSRLQRGISAVVPVFNSQSTLPQLVARLESVLRKTSREFEIVLVNDGSRDASWKTISDLARSRPWLRGIDLARNFGQENAILCGIRAAALDTLVILDDDLQNPPEEIPKLLAKLEEGFDVVYGVAHRERHSLWRTLGAKITKSVLQEAMGACDAQNVTAFKVMYTQLRESFHGFSSPYVAIDVLLTWGTQRFAAVAVRQDPRLVGQSNYTFGKLATHAMNLLTGFSSAPMRLVGCLGALIALAGGSGAVLTVSLGAKSIWLPILETGAIFSGLQLAALGLLSEYVLRMHARLMDRPPYAIRAVTESPLDHELLASDQMILDAGSTRVAAPGSAYGFFTKNGGETPASAQS